MVFKLWGIKRRGFESKSRNRYIIFKLECKARLPIFCLRRAPQLKKLLNKSTAETKNRFGCVGGNQTAIKILIGRLSGAGAAVVFDGGRQIGLTVQISIFVKINRAVFDVVHAADQSDFAVAD